MAARIAFRALVPLSALGLLAGSARADVVANADISFSNIVISASSGTIDFSGWTASSFAQGQNSLGESAANCSSPLNSCMDVGPGNAATAAAVVTYVSAAGSADATALTGAASSQVHIPGMDNASANGDGIASLTGTFEITGGAGSVEVTYSTSLLESLLLTTDVFGQIASGEITFSLSRDGALAPVLFSNQSQTIGPSTSFSYTNSGPLTNSELLDYNTPYSLTLEIDAESSGLNTPVPEGAPFWPGLTLLLLACAAYSKRFGKSGGRRAFQTETNP